MSLKYCNLQCKLQYFKDEVTDVSSPPALLVYDVAIWPLLRPAVNLISLGSDHIFGFTLKYIPGMKINNIVAKIMMTLNHIKKNRMKLNLKVGIYVVLHDIDWLNIFILSSLTKYSTHNANNSVMHMSHKMQLIKLKSI